jgi:hypothetical protein
MPGYSGTPLPKKLGLKPGQRVNLFHLPEDVADELKAELAQCQTAARGPLDYAHVFAKSQAEFEREFVKFAERLDPAGMLWASWPKKSSGVATDLDEGHVRRIGLAAGLVDVKVCAVTEVWSGLKFMVRTKDRPRCG